MSEEMSDWGITYVNIRVLHVGIYIYVFKFYTYVGIYSYKYI
jgi:hypothetical protein